MGAWGRCLRNNMESNCPHRRPRWGRVEEREGAVLRRRGRGDGIAGGAGPSGRE